MADPNQITGPVPPAPDISSGITSPYAAKAEHAPAKNDDIGYANKGWQVAQGITGVIQGLQQGYAQKQVEKFNQAKTSYSISKAQYDAAAARVAQLKQSGADPNSEDFKNAQAHLDQATNELSETTKSFVDLAHGGGGKGKNADPAHAGMIGKAMDILMGRVHPAQPTGTPPFVAPPTGNTSAAPSPTSDRFSGAGHPALGIGTL